MTSKIFFISLFTLLSFNSVFAISVNTSSSFQTNCPGANVNETIYITGDTQKIYPTDLMRSDNKLLFVRNEESSVSIWQNTANTLTSGCFQELDSSNTGWGRLSNVVPGTNQYVGIFKVFGNICDANKVIRTNTSRPSVQFVYRVAYKEELSRASGTSSYFYYPYTSVLASTPSYIPDQTRRNWGDVKYHPLECHNFTFAFCGDGVRDNSHGEACDDGNNIDGDGCSATCQTEVNPTCNSLVANPNSGNAPLTSSFTCSATSATSYRIDIFSGSTILNTINSSVGSYTFTNTGSYTARCTINGSITSNACLASITVGTTPPTPNIDINKVDANPADLDLVVGNDTQTVNVGTGAIFRIRVTNNYTESLRNLVLTDAIAPNCAGNVTLPSTFPSTWTGTTVGGSGDHTNTTLEVGEYIDYVCDRSNTTAGYTNSATVTGLGVTSNQSVTDTDTTVVLIPGGGGPTCGTAGGYSFSYTVTDWPSNLTFCSNSGATVNPNPPAFPAQNGSTSWTCSDTSGTVTCNASRGGPGSSSCFPAGTKISMSDGTYKNIEEVKIGDYVLSYDENQGTTKSSKVLELESPVRDHMCKLEFDDNTILELTREHPVFTQDGWKSIDPNETLKENSALLPKKLEIGDKILKKDGYVTLNSFSCEDKIIRTYNLKKVENYYTFYADDVTVHNKGGSGPSCVRISIPSLEAAGAGKAISSTGSLNLQCYGDSRAMVIGVDCDSDGNGATKSISYQENSTVSGSLRVAEFTCTYNNLNTVPHPKCYVTSGGGTVTTSSVSSLACSTGLSVGRNSCGDGVVQRPNSDGVMEECEAVNGVFPSWCIACKTTNFTIPVEGGGILTYPGGGNVYIRPFGQVIIGAGRNPFTVFGVSPLIGNDSSEDIYLNYPLCVHNSDSSVILRSNDTGLTRVCTANNIGWIYPGVSKTYESLNNGNPVNIKGVKITDNINYKDSIITTTLGDFKDAFFAAQLKVRVSKPAVATVGGGTSLIRNSNITADINKVAGGGYSDPDKNKNFVGAGVSTGSVSSYSKSVDSTNSITKISSGQTTKTQTNLNKITTTNISGNKSIGDTLSKYNGLSNVFIVKNGNLTINSSMSNLSGERTYIVEGGDLYINQNITYSDNIAFVVKGGNIIISSNVTSINGTFIAIKVGGVGGKITSAESDNKLIVNGSLYGDIESLVNNRTYIENKNNLINVGTIVSFGSNLFRKQAPLVGDFIGEYVESKKVAK